jgi:ABC-type glycerol-3-phosphate transport system permease component
MMASVLRFRALNAAMYAFVGGYALFVLLPLTWMVFAAFKTKREIFVNPLGMPSDLNLTSFARAWNVGLSTFMLNSALVTFLSVALIVIASGMAAYVLARSEVRLMRWIYLLIVAGFAVPLHSVLVPLYQMLSGAGMLNSRLAMVLPTAAFGIPFTTILFYAFFLDFPRELEDAARLDNCNRFQIFWRIILPLSGPALVSASIFQAVFIWNEFLLALLMLTRPALKTLPVGIFELVSMYTSDWPAIMAGLSIAILPIVVIFFFTQKYFVKSLQGLGK